MANITGNDSENPFGLSSVDLQFLDNLVGSFPKNSQPEPPPNEAQKESNYDYFLPTPPDNSNNGTLNASIYCQNANKSYNASDLCLPTPSDYFDFGQSPGSVNVVPISFQETDISCHEFKSGESSFDRGKTREKSANQSDIDAYNCHGDCSDPPDPVNNNRFDRENSTMSGNTRKRERPSRELERALFKEAKTLYDNPRQKRSRNEILTCLIKEVKYWRSLDPEAKS